MIEVKSKRRQHPRYHPELQVGQHFVLDERCQDGGTVYEVIRVSPCSALVRPARKTTYTYVGKIKKTRVVDGQKFKVDTGKTKLVEFSAPAGSFTISRCASVVLVEVSDGGA